MRRPIFYGAWMDEEESLILDEYAERKGQSYQPNFIQSLIDSDPAGIVVSVEPLENDRSHPDFFTQQILIDRALSYIQHAGLDAPTRRGTVFTWRYRLNGEQEWVPPAYDLSCYDDDHDFPVVVCLFYTRKDPSIEGGHLHLPSIDLSERTETGRVVVMQGGMNHVHTPCRGRGEMRMVAVALYVDPPEESAWSWWTERW